MREVIQSLVWLASAGFCAVLHMVAGCVENTTSTQQQQQQQQQQAGRSYGGRPRGSSSSSGNSGGGGINVSVGVSHTDVEHHGRPSGGPGGGRDDRRDSPKGEQQVGNHERATVLPSW